MMHSFSIRAVADPQALPRVTDRLARQWVTPTYMQAHRVGEELLITIRVGGLSDEAAEIVAASLSSSPLVHGVQLEPATPARPPLALALSS